MANSDSDKDEDEDEARCTAAAAAGRGFKGGGVGGHTSFWARSYTSDVI